MSFYGSVYYQLVDTFYKVITKNAALTKAEFPEDLHSDDQEIQALGRKGVLKIANGNKWINFTYNEDDNSFVVWHGKPDDTVSTVAAGYDYLGTTKPNGEITELKAGDYFSTFVSKYDEAGHLVPDSLEIKYYKMPKSETEEALAALEQLVGNKAKDAVLDELGNVVTPAEEASGLCLDVATNAANIKANLDRVIFLEDVYGKENAEVGNIFFDQTRGLDYSEEDPYTYKNFPTAFGSIDAIRSAYFGSANSEETVSDAIIRAKGLISEASNLAQSAIDANVYQEERFKTVEGSIKDLQTADTQINTEIARVEREYKAADSALNTSIGNLDTAYKAADAVINATITSLDSAYKAADSAINLAIGNLDTAYKAADGELLSKINALDTEYKAADGELLSKIDALDAAYKAADGDIGTAIAGLQSKDSEIDGEIAALHEEDSKIYLEIEDIKTFDTGAQESIGKIQQDIESLKNKDISLENAHTTINNNIGTINATQISMQDKITALENAKYGDAISAVSGRVTTLEDAKYGDAISGINASIEATNARVKALEDANYSSSITELDNRTDNLEAALGKQGENGELSTGLYATLINIQTQLNSLVSRIETLEGYHTPPTEPEPGTGEDSGEPEPDPESPDSSGETTE